MNTVRAMRVSQSQNSSKREGFLMAERQKVLIVDDDSNIAEIISLYLIKEMFETKVAERSLKMGMKPWSSLRALSRI